MTTKLKATGRDNFHQRFSGDCLELVPQLDMDIHLVVADPPYDKPKLINDAITVCREHCLGASFFFMYGENLPTLPIDNWPDQVLYWFKPPSTKNTRRRYSRFVEVIAVYDLDRSPFNQDTYWFTRSGVFQDAPLRTDKHPHTKPHSLIEKLLAVNSNKGDIVLDPFAGGHTVELACKRMGRSSISIEINA